MRRGTADLVVEHDRGQGQEEITANALAPFSLALALLSACSLDHCQVALALPLDPALEDDDPPTCVEGVVLLFVLAIHSARGELREQVVQNVFASDVANQAERRRTRRGVGVVVIDTYHAIAIMALSILSVSQEISVVWRAGVGVGADGGCPRQRRQVLPDTEQLRLRGRGEDGGQDVLAEQLLLVRIDMVRLVGVPVDGREASDALVPYPVRDTLPQLRELGGRRSVWDVDVVFQEQMFLENLVAVKISVADAADRPASLACALQDLVVGLEAGGVFEETRFRVRAENMAAALRRLGPFGGSERKVRGRRGRGRT